METKETNSFWKDRKVAVVQCGSFNPPHSLHMMLFECARDRLRECGSTVVCGIISPASDAYGKSGLLPASHRIEMCKRAAQDTNWVRCDDYEAKSPTFVRTLTTLTRVKEYVSAEIGEDVHPVLICGGDLLESFTIPGKWIPDHVETIFRDFGVICVHRDGFDEETIIKGSPVLSKYHDHVLVIEPYIHNDISSTLVRDIVKKNRSPRYIVPSGVYDYIIENKLYQ